MRESLTKAVESDAVLGEFVRKGIEAGCFACRKPVSAHFDHRGQWLGCTAAHVPVDTPFFLTPDRRQMGRRVTPEPLPVPHNGQERRHTPAPTTPKKVVPGATSRPAPSKPAVERVSGPQVVYVARYPVTASPIDRLPTHDRKVYGLIARARKGGATRAALLDHMKAHQHTGRVDGAVRRLRLRHVISVRAI